MKIFRMKNYERMSHRAATILAAQIVVQPDSVLGMATGSSPEGMYRELIRWYEKGDVDFSKIRTVNLDEYIGLDRDNPNSYAKTMRNLLFDHVNLDPANTNIPNGMEPDAETECRRYDQVIRSLGGIDFQILGMGHNGHIGFNEPADTFSTGTHAVDLTPETIQANQRFFDRAEDVPRRAYTMGIRDIMLARKVMMVVSGEAKAATVKAAFFGPITPRVPASVLQMHPDFTLVADEAALSLC